jgi:hypothetical protein
MVFLVFSQAAFPILDKEDGRVNKQNTKSAEK